MTLDIALTTIQHLEAKCREQQRTIDAQAAEARALRHRLDALVAQLAQGIARDPLPTVTVRYDLGAIDTEPLLRAKLVAMGWTPPKTHTPQSDIQPAKQQ